MRNKSDWGAHAMNSYMQKTPGVSEDFQKRAYSFEIQSRWVTSESINVTPYNYLSRRGTMGDVLDAGGGTGYLSSYLSKKIPASSLTIVDVSKNMLMLAKERIPGVNLINSSIESFCMGNNLKFDTVIARQIFHYVDDINVVLRLLREKLNPNGLFYVGQFVVCDDDANIWHENLIQQISKNRKRSFTLNSFQKAFETNGFKILECYTEDYEENIKDFYSRKTNDELKYDEFLKNISRSLNKEIFKKMCIRLVDNNLFFTVQFCHLLLERT